MWTTFAAVSGGASAGLTGLVFIVVAFRFETIAVSQEFRSRAAQSLTLFMTVTVVAMLITAPQGMRILGAEMAVAALVSATALRRLDSAAREVQRTPSSLTLVTALCVFVSTLFTSGVLLLLGMAWGMYFYLPSALVAIVFGALGAWIFLTRVGVDSAPANAST